MKLTFCARKQVDSSSMLQQLSILFHPPITYLMRGLPSSFHFPKTPLMKEGQVLMPSIPKSWPRPSMMWIPMITASTPISNLWWEQWFSSSTPSPSTPSQTSLGTVALHPEYPPLSVPSTLSSLSQIAQMIQLGSSTNHFQTSSQIHNDALTPTSLLTLQPTTERSYCHA